MYFAVEAVFPLQGFIRLIAAGRTSAEITAERSTEAIQAEVLTGAYQYEIWGMMDADNELFVEFVEEVFVREGVPACELPEDRLDAARGMIAELVARWSGLGPGETMELSLPARPEA